MCYMLSDAEECVETVFPGIKKCIHMAMTFSRGLSVCPTASK